jgi:hypothetical protein
MLGKVAYALGYFFEQPLFFGGYNSHGFCAFGVKIEIFLVFLKQNKVKQNLFFFHHSIKR